jgi:hypothetical protein
MMFLGADVFFYQGVSRWAFGMDNPNKAAAILAFLLLLLLALAVRTRNGWFRWCSGAAGAFVGYCLIHTFSRGGLAAFLVGAVVLLAGLRNSLFNGRRWLPVLLAACVIAGVAVWIGFAGRVAHSSPTGDASVGNRLAIWRNVPSMMVDAPGGWGHGSAGDAFMSWYQPLERHERYRTLVNSHFTWLVEFGWVGRFALVCFWMLAFGLGIMRWKERGDPLPLAVWASFATAAFFSSVAEDWRVGVVPVAMLVPAAGTFFSAAAARKRLVVTAALLASGLLLSVFVVLGVACRPADVLPVHRSADGARMTVGDRVPEGWVVCDAKTMGGAVCGRILRAFMKTPEGRGRAYGLARDLAAVPSDVRLLAICGAAADAGPAVLSRFSSLADVRVLSPNRPEDWLAARGKKTSVSVFCGEFAQACPADDAEGLTVVPGVAEFLPSWPRLAFGR